MKTCKKCFHNEVCPHLKDSDANRCKQYAENMSGVIYTMRGSNKSLEEIVGENIRSKRLERGWSQTKLANKIMSHTTSVSYWEAGKYLPHFTYVVAMADVFGCSIDELFGRVRICQRKEEI